MGFMGSKVSDASFFAGEGFFQEVNYSSSRLPYNMAVQVSDTTMQHSNPAVGHQKIETIEAPKILWSAAPFNTSSFRRTNN
jgi:hypothetical protein